VELLVVVVGRRQSLADSKLRGGGLSKSMAAEKEGNEKNEAPEDPEHR